jgi:hypothetical protein
VGWADPRWPSLIAVVDKAESEVVVELGVPLLIRSVWCLKGTMGGNQLRGISGSIGI